MIEIQGDTLIYWSITHTVDKKDLDVELAHKNEIANLSDDVVGDLISDSSIMCDPVQYKLQNADDIKHIGDQLKILDNPITKLTIDIVG